MTIAHLCVLLRKYTQCEVHTMNGVHVCTEVVMLSTMEYQQIHRHTKVISIYTFGKFSALMLINMQTWSVGPIWRYIQHVIIGMFQVIFHTFEAVLRGSCMLLSDIMGNHWGKLHKIFKSYELSLPGRLTNS